MVKYMVRLNTEEHDQLLALVNTGRAAAVKLLHARILLKADVGAGSRRWTDAAMADALDTSAATVHRVRQAFVERGLEAALSRKRPTGRQYRKLDGGQEAQLIAVAGRAPPEGRVRWTLKLLADTLVTLDIVDTISTACVRTTLKKMSSNRGSSGKG
jgi:Homeodomain-like domain